MNRYEHLLIKVMEECDEISQRAAKALLFGMYQIQSEQPFTNAERIILRYRSTFSIFAATSGSCRSASSTEYKDLQGILWMLGLVEEVKAAGDTHMTIINHPVVCPCGGIREYVYHIFWQCRECRMWYKVEL